MSDPNQNPDAIGRRHLIKRGAAVSGAAAVGAGIAVLAGGEGGPGPSPATADPAGGTYLRITGATGDGRADDTAALQQALNAAPAGSTVVGDAGAIYALGGKLTFPADHVTLDLTGAAVRPLEERADAPMIEIAARQGVRLTGGRVLPAVGGGDASKSTRVVIADGYRCVVDSLDADCAGAQLVAVQNGSDHLVAGNHVLGGSLGGFSGTNVVFRGNVIEDSPQNAIGYVGYGGAPSIGVSFEDNVIRGYGRVAIENYADADGACTGTVARGNRISAGDRGGSTGISILSSGALIEGNDIQDAGAYGIECLGNGVRCVGNRVAWESAGDAGRTKATGIVVNSASAVEVLGVVSSNQIHNALYGISAAPRPFLAALVFTGNVITEAGEVAIDASLGGGVSGEGVTCSGNVIRFSTPPPGKTRTGIRAGLGAQLTGNRLTYTPESESGNEDVPVSFDADEVMLVGNVIDGRGRSNLVCRPSRIGLKRMQLVANQFVGGASADLGKTLDPVLSANIGPVLTS